MKFFLFQSNRIVFVNAEVSKEQQGKSDKPFIDFVARLLVLVTASLLIATFVEAEEQSVNIESTKKWVFLPKLTGGMMHYKYKLGAGSRTSEIDDPPNYSENLFVVGVGTTFAYDNKFFIDAHFQTTTIEDVVENSTFTTVQGRTVYYTRDTGLRRSDYAIALGYAMTKDFKLFMGYNGSKTSYNWTDNERDNERDDEAGNVGSAIKDNRFRTKGPFIGGAYGWRIGGGVLGASFAFAYLDGKIETNRVHTEGDSEQFTLTNRHRIENVSSDTIGWKLGISWHKNIDEKLSYGISFSGFRYDFEAKNGTFHDDQFSNNRIHDILNLDAYDVRETLLSINASLRYRF